MLIIVDICIEKEESITNLMIKKRKSSSNKVYKEKDISFHDFIIKVQYKKIKNIYLRIKQSTGTIEMTVPMGCSDDVLNRFLVSKELWIEYHYERVQATRKEQAQEEKRYDDGNMIQLWGKPITLHYRYDQPRKNILYADGSWVISFRKSEDTVTDKERYERIKEGYRMELKHVIPSYLSHWESVIGVTSEEFYIRDMKGLWGSCHTIKKKITLNLQLARYPMECLEYVIVHELVHLLEASHNSRFYGFMDQYLPDWKRRKAIL